MSKSCGGWRVGELCQAGARTMGRALGAEDEIELGGGDRGGGGEEKKGYA